MNTKKILSLLLSVVMIVCCGVVAFAAPTGYDAYIQSGTTQILSEGQTLYSGAAMPVLDGEGAIRADVSVTPISDAELYEAYGATPADFGLTTGWVDSGYMVTVDLKNLGTLVYNRAGATAALYKYNGFRMINAKMNFSFSSEDVFCVGALGSSVDETLEKYAGNGFVTEEEYKVEYQDTTGKTAYPSSGTATDADNFATLLFFAKPGSVVSLSNGIVLFQNFKNSEAKDADGNAWSNTTVAYWHPASITLGAAAPQGPTVDKVEETTSAGITAYTVSTLAEKVIMTKTFQNVAVKPGMGLVVTNNGVTREFGGNLYEYLGSPAEGTVTIGSLTFGLVVDNAAQASQFTFELR